MRMPGNACSGTFDEEPLHCRAYLTIAQLKNLLYRSIEFPLPGYSNSQLHFHRATTVENDRTDDCCPNAIQTHHTPILPTRQSTEAE